MYYLVGAIIILFLLIFVMIYLYKKTSIITIIDKVKNKYLRIIIRIFLIIIPFLIFGFVNGVVVVLHAAIFFGIFDIINLFVKNKTNLFNALAVIATVIYLGIGLYQDFHIYETVYNIDTTKNIGVDNFRIIQLSDSHTGTTFDGNKFKEIVKNINKTESDIVVITGDAVDDSTTYEDMVLTCEAFGLFTPKYGTYFVFGNHDKGYYGKNFTGEDLRRELIKNNIRILEDEVVDITDNIVLVGRQDREVTSRASIKDLTANIDSSKYIIDLNHQPNDYENESNAGVDLVLSGHSHGGQIFPLGPVGKWIGANDEYTGLHKRKNTTFIVNTGISGWEIIFKTMTKSEYTVINIRSNNE